ncbi:hypothetical protein CEXT_125201 [Caerostris extrusa]|uniref:Uncharacterized protein n=1 Tax=Caerostris extrusa TaxID=172846 RepID=A0AAV4MWX3_CAEEX|nr:hypothetical protein CEXT_125201 [Caerostris extrusa]
MGRRCDRACQPDRERGRGGGVKSVWQIVGMRRAATFQSAGTGANSERFVMCRRRRAPRNVEAAWVFEIVTFELHRMQDFHHEISDGKIPEEGSKRKKKGQIELLPNMESRKKNFMIVCIRDPLVGHSWGLIADASIGASH